MRFPDLWELVHRTGIADEFCGQKEVCVMLWVLIFVSEETRSILLLIYVYARINARVDCVYFVHVHVMRI